MKSKHDEYANGLLNCHIRFIKVIENEIISIKQSGTENGSFRFVTNSGKLSAYNKILNKLKASKIKIQSRIDNSNE